MKTYHDLSRALITALIAVLAVFTTQSFAKTFVLPHVLDSKGRISNTPFTFDTDMFYTYTGQMDTGAVVELYLYGAFGELIVSASGNPVCGPCTETLGAERRRVAVSVEDAAEAAGGFPNGVSSLSGFAVITVTGDTDEVALSGELTHANSGPLDLSITGLNLRESPTRASTGRTSKTYVLPHVLESGPPSAIDAAGFDMKIVATYASGLPGSGSASGADLQLYLYDESGMPMQSSTGLDVCNPCLEALSATERKKSLNVEALILAKGGFDKAVKTGFGIIVVGGADPDMVALQGFVVNSHTSALDLSVFGFDPVPITAADRTTLAEVKGPAMAKAFSGSPNPSARGVDFSFDLGNSAAITVELFTLDGRKVAQPFQGNLGSGRHTVRWNGSNVAAGTYFARLSGDEGSRVTRLVIIR